MTERIGPGEVRRVAGLARLELTAEEAERIAAEMARLLGHFDDLDAAAPAGEGEGEGEEGAPPRSGPGSALRPDEPDADPLERGPGAWAPEWRDGHFLLPRLEGMEGDVGGVGGGDDGGEGDGEAR